MKDCASRSIHLYSFSTCLNSDPHFSYSFWLCFLSGYATGIERRVDYATSCWLEPVGALPPRRAVLFAETPEVHGFGLANDLPIVSSGSSSSGFATRYQKIPPPPSNKPHKLLRLHKAKKNEHLASINESRFVYMHFVF